MPRTKSAARAARSASIVPALGPGVSAEEKRFAAFCARMAEVEPTILGIARRAGADPDDLVAQVWVRGWERYGDLANHPDVKAYLTRIARNLVSDSIRRARRQSRHLAGAAAHDETPALVSFEQTVKNPANFRGGVIYSDAAALGAAPHLALETRARQEALNRAIDCLPFRQRVAIENAIACRPISDTAAQLRIKPPAASEHLSRARAALAEALMAIGISVPTNTTRPYNRASPDTSRFPRLAAYSHENSF